MVRRAAFGRSLVAEWWGSWRYGKGDGGSASLTYIAIELLKHLMAFFHNEQCSLDSEVYMFADSFYTSRTSQLRSTARWLTSQASSISNHPIETYSYPTRTAYSRTKPSSARSIPPRIASSINQIFPKCMLGGPCKCAVGTQALFMSFYMAFKTQQMPLGWPPAFLLPPRLSATAHGYRHI